MISAIAVHFTQIFVFDTLEFTSGQFSIPILPEINNFSDPLLFISLVNLIAFIIRTTKSLLIDFRSMFHFYTPGKSQKTRSFSGVQKWNMGLKWINKDIVVLIIQAIKSACEMNKGGSLKFCSRKFLLQKKSENTSMVNLSWMHL